MAPITRERRVSNEPAGTRSAISFRHRS
jgi:hypothetical protein